MVGALRRLLSLRFGRGSCEPSLLCGLDHTAAIPDASCYSGFTSDISLLLNHSASHHTLAPCILMSWYSPEKITQFSIILKVCLLTSTSLVTQVLVQFAFHLFKSFTRTHETVLCPHSRQSGCHSAAFFH